jgi:glycerol-3-phosphate acyltransferase PlsY
MIAEIFIFAAASYLYGAIPYAHIATYLFKRKNLSKEGTGNIGVTNAFKVGGYAAATITVLGETSKALVPIVIAHRFFSGTLYITLLFVYLSLVGTSFSIFLKGKGGKGSTVAMWSLLILSPYSLFTLLALWIVVLKVSRGNFLIKKIPLLFIPIVIYYFEHDIMFALFGLLTSILFYLNSYRRKDDFVHYGIFHRKSDLRDTSDAHTLHS